MKNLDNTIIYDGCINNVKIIIDNTLIQNDYLKWNITDKYYGEQQITLKEIYKQLKSKIRFAIIYVWIETPLEGKIYMCGNYKQGEWVEHGTTKGYA